MRLASLLLCALVLFTVRAEDVAPRCKGTALDPNIANRNYTCGDDQWSFSATNITLRGVEFAAWNCIWQVRLPQKYSWLMRDELLTRTESIDAGA